MKRKYFWVLLIFTFIAAFAAVKAANIIEINTASLQQLDEITGIGPVLAQRIIDARPFLTIDDLLKVKGIGPITLQKIKDQGLACVGCQPTQEISNSQLPISNKNQSPNNQNLNPAPDTQNPPPVVVYPNGIFINEILPSPKGADETDEWIELYNSNNSDIDLSGWKLQDVAGTTTTYIFPINTKISANGYLVLKRPNTNIMLNNDQDGLNLIFPDGKITDSVLYENSSTGQSYNKTGNGWQWSTTLTSGAKNIVTTLIKVLPKPKISGNNTVDKSMAAISEPAAININNVVQLKTQNPWLLFLVVLTITIILGMTLLIIKLKLHKKVILKS